MLTRAKLRDEIVRKTKYRPDVVAHVLDVFEELVRAELLQQGEVSLRGLFRVVPVRRLFYRQPRTKPSTEKPAKQETVERIVLTIRPMRALRDQLTAVLPSR